MPIARGSTRSQMIASAAELLRERGADGVTIDSVLSRSAAPRGSVYHHFPGGRKQILSEALRYAGDAITAEIDDTVADGALVLLHRFAEHWQQTLLDSDYTAGCPVAATAVGSASDDAPLISDAGAIFSNWCAALSRAFTAEGFAAADAHSLATMCVAAMEGAVLLCRAGRSSEPLRDVTAQLEFLIKAKEFVRRNPVPGT